MNTILLLTIAVAGGLTLWGGVPLAAQTLNPSGADASTDAAAAQPGPTDARRRFVFDDRPSLRLGRALRIDLRVKLQADWSGAAADAHGNSDPDRFDLHRKRIGIEGDFLGRFEYQLERELDSKDPWRDVFVDARYRDALRVRAGKFKMPVSRDRLTSPTRLDFIHRSRLGDALAPGRDVGVAVHGRWRRRALDYMAGLFTHGGEEPAGPQYARAGATAAGRITARPFHRDSGASALRDLEVGFNVSSGQVAEGLRAPGVRTIFDVPLSSAVYVNGRQIRLGVDAVWRRPRCALAGEYLRLRDERLAQGLIGEDLPPLLSTGWYVSGTWVVAGRLKGNGFEPRQPLFGGGAGALELALRHEHVGLASIFENEAPSRSPRAAHIPASGERIWTFGVNWHLNRWVRLQLNAIREQLDDVERSPTPGRQVFWSSVSRLQLAL